MADSVRARTSRPVAPQPTLVLKAVGAANPPRAEKVVLVPRPLGVQIARNRAADDLGAKHTVAATDLGELSHLFVGQVYGGAHDT